MLFCRCVFSIKQENFYCMYLLRICYMLLTVIIITGYSSNKSTIASDQLNCNESLDLFKV